MNNRRRKHIASKLAQYSPERRDAMSIKSKRDCKRKYKRGKIREERSNGDS